MIKKIRPLAELAKRSDEDGWSSWWGMNDWNGCFCGSCNFHNGEIRIMDVR